MKEAEFTQTARDEALDEYPEYDVEYYYDVDETPTTVILCSTDSAGHLATEWLCCEAEHVVPMEAIP